jgi:phosphohistidine phosphatase
MPSLILFRHAKAAQPLPDQRDFDRALTERGQDDAAAMGRLLADRPCDLALVSPACRTRETWDIAARAIAAAPAPLLEPALYLCAAAKLIARLRQVPPTVPSVISVGHNPCTQELAAWLARASAPRLADDIRDNFPTAAMAIFDIDGGWDRLAPEHAVLRRFVTPKMLG